MTDGTRLDSLMDGGAIGINLSGQLGGTSWFGLGGSGIAGGQILYQPSTGEFGFFGFGGGALHGSVPLLPVAGYNAGLIITTPMDGLDDYAGGFVGSGGTVYKANYAFDQGYDFATGQYTGVDAETFGLGEGTPLHINFNETTYYVGWTTQHGWAGFGE